MTYKKNYSLDVVAPIFPVTDIDSACDYYIDKLDFTLSFKWSDSDGEAPNYAIVLNGDTELHLTLVKEKHKTAAYFFVSNVQGYCDLVKTAGANIVNDIKDQPWEMREFEVSDLDGNVIIFGEHISRIK